MLFLAEALLLIRYLGEFSWMIFLCPSIMNCVSYLGREKNGANFEFLGSLTLNDDFLELVDLMCLLLL